MLTKEGARQCQAAASGDTEAPRASASSSWGDTAAGFCHGPSWVQKS